MQILFENGVQVPVKLTDSPVQDTVLSIYKHLQHITIPRREWDNPYYLNIDYNKIVDRLEYYANKVSVKIDRNRCLQRDQEYLNFIHKIYEQNCTNDPAWFDYHEHVHMFEDRYWDRHPWLIINYREKAGPLEKTFNMDWLSGATTQIKAGDVFLEWAELGKRPYTYWENKEPNDINRICQLVKPWLTLRPKLHIAFEDRDLLADKQILEFENWWSEYSKPWCQHWNIPNWTIVDQSSVLVIGHIDQINKVINCLKNQIYPIKVQL